jgi:hypothetical protein
MHFGAFHWVSRGAGFTRQIPNQGGNTILLAQPINPIIHEFSHPKLLIKVPAAVLADDDLMLFTVHMHCFVCIVCV